MSIVAKAPLVSYASPSFTTLTQNRHTRNAGALDSVYLVSIAVTSFVGQYALNKSYQMLPASYAAGLSYVQVAWGYCLGIFTLHEAVNRFRYRRPLRRPRVTLRR
jgi:drug/metabolite transporter (DMT)-like permease